MSSHPQKFSLVGRLVINDLFAVVIYLVSAQFYPAHWAHLAGLIVLAVVCAVVVGGGCGVAGDDDLDN